MISALFVPFFLSAAFALPIPSPECEIRKRGDCTYEQCLLPPSSTYPRPTLTITPDPKGPRISALRIHFHGWTQDEGRPRNPSVDFAWKTPSIQPKLGELEKFTSFYDFASAACAPVPEKVAIPLSRGHNDDYKTGFPTPERFRAYVEQLQAEDSPLPLRISAHSGGGNILAKLTPFEGLHVERVKLLDTTYRLEKALAFLPWISEPDTPDRVLEVYSVTPATAGPAREMQRLLGDEPQRFRLEIDLTGTYDHYSIVPARFRVVPEQKRKVLILGDSHTVGTYGQTLDRLFRADPGQQVRTFGSCGSIIRWWYTGQSTTCGYLGIDESGRKVESARLPTPFIPKILSAQKPDLTIVELGANYMVGYPESAIRADVARLLEDIRKSGTRCVWVGPPHMRRFDSELRIFVPFLRSLVEKTCTWIDSREFTSYPASGGDGIHYGTPALKPLAEKWAREIFRAINQNHPKH
jgi:hypothetical protein